MTAVWLSSLERSEKYVEDPEAIIQVPSVSSLGQLAQTGEDLCNGS